MVLFGVQILHSFSHLVFTTRISGYFTDEEPNTSERSASPANITQLMQRLNPGLLTSPGFLCSWIFNHTKDIKGSGEVDPRPG